MSFSRTWEPCLWNRILVENSLPVSKSLGGWGPNCCVCFIVKLPAVIKIGGSSFFSWVRPKDNLKFSPPRLSKTLHPLVSAKLCSDCSLYCLSSWNSLKWVFYACLTLPSTIFALASKNILKHEYLFFCHWAVFWNFSNQGSKCIPLWADTIT